MTRLYMQAIEGRFQNAPEHLRHYILDEVRKGLDSLPEILASNLPPKSVSPQASPQEEVPEESGPSGSAVQPDKPEEPKPPPSEAPTATNDEDSNSNSGSDVEYCPHTEGRIRYPNLACKECQRNFDFQQTFYMGLAM
jgi:cell division septation protein DedD